MYRQTDAITASSHRKLSPDPNVIIGKASLNADSESFPRLGDCDIVSNPDVVINIVGVDRRPFVGTARGCNVDLHFIIVNRQRAGLRAEVPLEIVPLPAISDSIATKITFIPDYISLHSLHSALHEGQHQLLQRIG